MQSELKALRSQESHLLFQREYQQAYDVGLDGILNSSVSNTDGVIALLQLIAATKQLRQFLTKEERLLLQIETELKTQHEEQLSKARP